MLSNCSTCTANAFAMKVRPPLRNDESAPTLRQFLQQGYLECKEETNNWEAIVKAYEGQSLVFSIGGHGARSLRSIFA